MTKHIRLFVTSSLCLSFGAASALAASDVMMTRFEPGKGAGRIDYANAIPMPTPTIKRAPNRDAQGSRTTGAAGVVRGAAGSGKKTPVALFDDKTASAAGGITPQEYGISEIPFTTSRVDLTPSNAISTLYPYSATGKLFFKDKSRSYVCSGALIQPGLVVTAAHCVVAFGEQRVYSSFQFVPAYYGGVAPYGKWSAAYVWVKPSYYDGTDSCAGDGVVCENDIALLVLQGKSGSYPGDSTGFYGFGWDGYGFTSNGEAMLHQLAYPVSHDAGKRMQRNDAPGYQGDLSLANNTYWGSRMTGGSSGGPLVVNLGVPAILKDTEFGSAAHSNIVVGVTNWSYDDDAIKTQGGSPFLSTNILSLYESACEDTPEVCELR